MWLYDTFLHNKIWYFVLSCHANTLSPLCNILQININPSRILHIYTRKVHLPPIYQYQQYPLNPKGSDGICPSVRIIRTCDYFTESYYDKHTNTTEICPDYNIDLLERSICLIFSIIIKIRYVSRCVVQIYKLISIQQCMWFHPNIAYRSTLLKRPL